MSQEKENRQHENAQSVQEGQQPHKRRVRYKGRYPKKFEEKYKELQPEKYQDTIQHVMQKGNTPAGMHISIMVKEIIFWRSNQDRLALMPHLATAVIQRPCFSACRDRDICMPLT